MTEEYIAAHGKIEAELHYTKYKTFITGNTIRLREFEEKLAKILRAQNRPVFAF